MRGKLFKHMFLVAMSVFVACTALFMWSLYSYFTEARQSEQREETAYAAAAVEEGGKTFLQTKLPKDSANRITWIDRDGTVLFDSVAKAEDMENHADRDEVKQAMETGEGESTRYSSTLSRKTTNYALRLDDGTILRLSGTQYTVVSLLVSQFQALVAVLVLAVGLSAFLAYRVSESIIEPINRISLENPDERDVYPELRPLVRRIGGQNKQIQYQMEALRQAHKQQDELRREFTANVSHELKTPLTVISGYAQLTNWQLAQGQADQGMQDHMTVVSSEAQRLSALVSELIELSKGGGRETQTELIELPSLFEAAAKVCQPLLDKRQNRLVCTGGAGLCISGNRGMLLQLLINLTMNANKHTQGGTITYRASLLPGRGNLALDTVCLLVEDTGEGIPEERIPYIFDKGYSGDGGSGIGLYICQDVVKYHGGTLTLASTGPGGTTFRILLPHTPEAAQPD